MYVSSCIIFIYMANPLTSFDNLWHKNHRTVFTFHYLTVYIPVKNAKKKPLWHLGGHSRPQLKNPVLRKRRSVKFSGRRCPTSSNRDKMNWEVNVYFFPESFWWWFLIHLPPCAERYWSVTFVTIQSAKPYQLKADQ